MTVTSNVSPSSLPLGTPVKVPWPIRPTSPAPGAARTSSSSGGVITLPWITRWPSTLYTSTGALCSRMAPMKPVINPFCSDCWNRIRNTRSAIAATSNANRTFARAISLNARNIERRR